MALDAFTNKNTIDRLLEAKPENKTAAAHQRRRAPLRQRPRSLSPRMIPAPGGVEGQEEGRHRAMGARQLRTWICYS